MIDWNQTWVDDADPVILGEEGLLVRDSRFQVVDPFHVGKAGPSACVGECPILIEGLALQVRREIVKWVCAREIVVLVAPYETA